MTNKQQRALQCLLICPTRKEAAEMAGITQKTLYNYLSDPEFKAAYERSVSSIVDDAARQCQQCLNPAITALKSICEDESQIPTARVSAARSLIEYALRLSEISNILKTLEGTEGSGGGDVL